jgi:hypothetical protein
MLHGNTMARAAAFEGQGMAQRKAMNFTTPTRMPSARKATA